MPFLVRKDYKGFNIVTYNGKYYGISQSLGPINLTCLEEQKDIKDIKGAVLVEENYKGFNIVHYTGKYFGLAIDIGKIDLAKSSKDHMETLRLEGRCMVSDEYKEIKEQIERSGYAGVPSLVDSPRLVEEGYKGFNIFTYKDRYYAVAQSLGPIDFTRIEERKLNEYREIGKCFIGNSFKEVKHFVNQYAQSLESEPLAIKSARDPILTRTFIELGLSHKDVIKKIPLLSFVAKKTISLPKECSMNLNTEFNLIGVINRIDTIN
jgi:hypothetical protein